MEVALGCGPVRRRCTWRRFRERDLDGLIGRAGVLIEQIFDMIVAIAKIHGDPNYLKPIFETMLDGLRLPTDGNADDRAAGAS
jgi:hypothetical protein